MRMCGRLQTAICFILVVILAGCGAPPAFEVLPDEGAAMESITDGQGSDVGSDFEPTEEPITPEPWVIPDDFTERSTTTKRSPPPPPVPTGNGHGNGASSYELSAGGIRSSSDGTDQPFNENGLERLNAPEPSAPTDEVNDDEESAESTPTADDGVVLEKVYYGTNRRPQINSADRWAAYETALRRFQVLLVIGLTLCGVTFYVPRRRLLPAIVALLSLGGAAWSGRQASLEYMVASLDDDNENRRYGNEIHFVDGQHELERGYCWVSVPIKVHERGSGHMELPGMFELRADPEKHFTLQRVEQKEHSDFLQDLREAVQSSDAKHAFVFIHGYNVLFREAALRTAQLRYDLDFDGPAAFFSWPSNGSLLSYASDEETANLTERSGVLHDFLLDFINETGAESVHLIAHSMGNRLMTRAFEKLPNATNSDGHKTISQLIMAAPDVNPAEFMLLADRIRELTRARTLYASEKDIALIGSEVLRMSNYTRLGQGGASRVIIDGVQTIDASGLSRELFDLGHSYYVHPKVMQDLKHLLNSAAVAPQRPWLMSIDDYWVFRDE